MNGGKGKGGKKGKEVDYANANECKAENLKAEISTPPSRVKSAQPGRNRVSSICPAAAVTCARPAHGFLCRAGRE